MPKFTLTAEWDNPDSTVTHTFNEECLDDVLMCLDQFLRGCGYYYDGALAIAEEPLYTQKIDHNDYYYDKDRNR